MLCKQRGQLSLIITTLNELREVLFLALCVTFCIAGIAERFTPNSQGECLFPRSDEFECQGQRS